MSQARRSDGKVVGEFVTDQGEVWLLKTGLDESKHMLLEPKGWATDKEHIDKLALYRGKGVRIETVQSRVWIGTLQAFLSYGVNINRGSGEQVALPIRYWREVSKSSRQSSLFKESEGSGQ